MDSHYSSQITSKDILTLVFHQFAIFVVWETEKGETEGVFEMSNIYQTIDNLLSFRRVCKVWKRVLDTMCNETLSNGHNSLSLKLMYRLDRNSLKKLTFDSENPIIPRIVRDHLELEEIGCPYSICRYSIQKFGWKWTIQAYKNGLSWKQHTRPCISPFSGYIGEVGMEKDEDGDNIVREGNGFSWKNGWASCWTIGSFKNDSPWNATRFIEDEQENYNMGRMWIIK